MPMLTSPYAAVRQELDLAEQAAALIEQADPKRRLELNRKLRELEHQADAERKTAQAAYDRAVEAYVAARDTAIAALEETAAEIEGAFAAFEEVERNYTRLQRAGVEPGPRPERASVRQARDASVRHVFERFRAAQMKAW